ncbi:MAG: flagellar hook-length control protein FliK [Gammaproteobacteria bacterium]
MQINQPSPLTQALDLKTIKATLDAWQTGQIVKATVVTPPRNGTMTIEVNRIQLLAHDSQPHHKTGDSISLEVIKTGQQPVLRVVNQTPQPQQAIPTPTAVKTEALKVLLPRQTSITPLLNQIINLVNVREAKTQPLPNIVTQQLKELIRSVPTRTQISQPEGLKQSLIDSGLFLENKLVKQPESTIKQPVQHIKENAEQMLRGLFKNGSSSQSAPRTDMPAAKKQVDNDIKTGLIRVVNSLLRQLPAEKQTPAVTASTTPSKAASTLLPNPLPHGRIENSPSNPVEARQAPPAQTLENESIITRMVTELLQLASGALARVQVNQLASVPGEDQNTPILSFELPVKSGEKVETIQIKIGKEDKGSQEYAEPRWTATLTINVESLGSIHALVTVTGNQVWTKLWAEQPEALELINREVQKLDEGFRKKGLEVGNIQCQRGMPPVHFTSAQSHQLVDINV